MPSLIPPLNSCIARMTSGKKRFAVFLEQKLDDDYLIWYDVPIGKKQLHPDFIILHPLRGLLVLEVKDWKIDTILNVTKSTWTIADRNTNEPKQVKNPLEQARNYLLHVMKLLERDPKLVHEIATPKAGKCIIPYGYGVVFTNITRAVFDKQGLGDAIESNLVICQDEMYESIDDGEFKQKLWNIFPYQFDFSLSPNQVNRIRWHIFPDIAIQSPLLPEQDEYNSPLQLLHYQEDIMNTSTKISPEYKLFVPAKIAENGGEMPLTLVSGNKLICKVVPEISNGSRQVLRKGTDVSGFVNFYHLWSQSTNYRDELTKCIDSFNVKTVTRELLEQTISSLIDSEKPTLNLAILDLLDYIFLSKKKIGVMSSEEDKEFHKRYTIATQFARIKLLDDVVEKSLQQSTLDYKIRGVWQLVILQNPIDDWNALKALDEIVFNAKLPQIAQSYYSKASLLVKTITTDLWVLRVIQEAFQNNNEQLNDYANEWHQIRDGKADVIRGFFVDESKRKQTRDNLDRLVLTSDIPEEAKIIYQLVRNGEVRNNEQEIQDLNTLEEQFKKAKKTVEDATKIYSKVENFAVKVGAKAGTGMAIGALSGAAKVTATLAWLGAGSVASGGLGMIGGLAVLTGGAALLGAVAVFSMASLMGGMDKEEKKFAAVGAVGGLGVGAGVAWGVWSVALASSSYSGAAAITSTLAMFGGGSLATGGLGMSGGLMVITGGAAAIAIVAGVSLSWFLNEKNREKIVRQLEEQAIKIDKELSDLGVQAPNY